MDLPELCKTLPRRLSWSGGLEHPWARGWVDVWIGSLCQPLDLNWLLTVVPSQEKASEDCLPTPYDEEVLVLSSTEALYRGKTFEGDYSYWEQACFWDDDLYRVPVWSIEEIEKAIHEWILQYGDRSFCLRWNEADQSPMIAEAEGVLEEIRSGEMEVFDLGDGIKASSVAMDALLHDPDMAAEAMRQLKTRPE